jgi:hypothetical protein
MSNILQVILSVLAAAFGVQSSKNHQRDFSQSSPKPYIIVGIAFTIIFIVILLFSVKLAIKLSG